MIKDTTGKPKQGSWTPERRRKQAEIIRQNKPWEKSTGPKTQKGKDICSMNALKHGGRSCVLAQYHRALTLQAQFVKQIQIAVIHDKRCFQMTNELKKKRFKSDV